MVFHFPDPLPTLLVSFHPSQQNTQTGRLTAEAFQGIFDLAKAMVSQTE